MPPTPPVDGPDLLRGLVDAAPEALLVVDATGCLRLVNRRAETVFGADAAELVGGPVAAWLPDVFGSIAAPGTPWSRGEVTRLTGSGVRADGQVFPAEVSISPLPMPETVLACASVRDLSDRLAVERASERVRDELIANVSHELRTPLTSIMGYTEVLVDLGVPVVSQEALKLLDIVRRNAERQLGVVEDLLTLAVLGGNGLHVEPVPTDLGVIVRGALAELGSQAAEAGVALVPGGVRTLHVMGDPGRLAEVVTNLVTGALKFSGAGEQVEVRLGVDGDHGLLEVVDRGSTASLTSAALSTGERPRLPLVRGIVEAHAGRLGVAHEPGRGTTVQVRLPLARA